MFAGTADILQYMHPSRKASLAATHRRVNMQRTLHHSYSGYRARPAYSLLMGSPSAHKYPRPPWTSRFVMLLLSHRTATVFLSLTRLTTLVSVFHSSLHSHHEVLIFPLECRSRGTPLTNFGSSNMALAPRRSRRTHVSDHWFPHAQLRRPRHAMLQISKHARSHEFCGVDADLFPRYGYTRHLSRQNRRS